MTTQLSAQQILKDTFNQKTSLQKLNKIDILDLDELKDLQLRKRTEFESYLKRNRLDLRQWLRYARFESEQRDMQRARSIFERCLLVDINHIPTWIAYIDLELKNKYINHARNLMDRAVTTLPRADKLWYKYLFVEESLQEWNLVRSIYKKWISLEPNKNAWDSFIDFETRQRDWSNVRNIFTRYISLYPQLTTWNKWIHFEKIYGDMTTIRDVFNLALDTMLKLEPILHNSNDIIKLCIKFAHWETSQQEFDRTAMIFKIALEIWPNDTTLLQQQLNFQKSFGNVATLSTNVIDTRKFKYEQHLSRRKYDYDIWWIYLDLIENYYPNEFTQSLEDAFMIVPYQEELVSDWEKYIFICLRYLCYLELTKIDINKCRSVYNKLINEIIPHKLFTFNHVWIMFVQFEIRQDDFIAVEKIMDRSLETCPSETLFKSYINLQIKLKNFDQVRNLYEKAIQFNPSDHSLWFQYTDLEENLGDTDRCRQIFQIMCNEEINSFDQSTKSKILEKFIDFETNSQEFDNGKKLYESLLKLNKFNVDTWIKFAMYNYSVPTDEQLEKLKNIQDKREQEDNDENSEDEDQDEFEPDATNFKLARSVFEKALNYFKLKNNNISRSQILEALMEFANNFGEEAEQQSIKERLPKINKKIELMNGIETETLDYIFPDDEVKLVEKPKMSKLLAMAKKWKNENTNE